MSKSAYATVLEILLEGHPWTLLGLQQEVKHRTGQFYTDGTLSRRVRECRKAGHDVRRSQAGGKRGTWYYKIEKEGANA